MATVKRVLKEYAQLEKEPLGNIWVQTDESNILRCVCYFKANEFWIPMVVLFPSDYPIKPPDVGFPIDFGYTEGASYIKSDGPLKGMMVICLDILGNFAHVHNEWAGVKGSGWSPSYTLTSLLVNMQTVILDSIECKSESQLATTKAAWERYAKENSIEVPSAKTSSVLDYDSLRSDQEVISAIKVLENKFGQLICQELGAIIEKIKSQQVETKPSIDPDIFCWFTSANYTEDIMGYGIKLKPQGRIVFLSTDGNYISYSAYSNQNLRQYPTKETFDFFLPGWINPVHSSESVQWASVLKSCINQIGKSLSISSFDLAATRIYSDLINTMIVKIMDSRSDTRASSVVFRCLLNLIRTFGFLIDSTPSLKKSIETQLKQFITNKSSRTKASTPNVGNVLALSLISNLSFSWPDFLKAFEEECHLRRVLWWQKERVKLDPSGTFTQSKISRNNVLFQVLLRSVLSSHQFEELDRLNCGIEGGVEQLLDLWKQIDSRMEAHPSWTQYYSELKSMGLPESEYIRISGDVSGYINTTIINASKISGYTVGK
jgi:ubiquitin-protein ligase